MGCATIDSNRVGSNVLRCCIAVYCGTTYANDDQSTPLKAGVLPETKSASMPQLSDDACPGNRACYTVLVHNHCSHHERADILDFHLHTNNTLY